MHLEPIACIWLTEESSITCKKHYNAAFHLLKHTAGVHINTRVLVKREDRHHSVNLKSAALFSSFYFFSDQSQFSAGLPGDRTILLRPSHQVWNYIPDGTKWKILADRKACFGKVEGYVIAHSIQLGEMDTLIIMRNL